MTNTSLDIARELGKSIINSDIYKDYILKEEKYNNDDAAMHLLNEIENNNIIYKKMISDKNFNDAKLIKKKLDELEKKMKANKSYIKYIESKNRVENLTKNINSIIEFYTGFNMSSNCSKCSK